MANAARAVLLAAVLIIAPAVARAQGPLPLDPLTPQERAVADSAATSDPRVREFIGAGRSRQIHLDFISAKSGARGEDVPPTRHAEVLFYNYDRDLGVLALVDLSRRRVVDVARVPGKSVPINSDEVADAARLALADPRVARLFGGQMPSFRVATKAASREELGTPRIEGLRLVGGAANDPCTRHRCVMLFFRVDNRYVQMNRVAVDLTAQQVLIREGER